MVGHVGKVAESRREYWSKLIAEQEASGKAVGPFCRERGVGEATFYQWRKRLRASKTVRFAVLEAKGGTADLVSGLELVLSSGERLRIGKGVDAPTLRLVLDVIRA
jgi:transposase-like protein